MGTEEKDMVFTLINDDGEEMSFNSKMAFELKNRRPVIMIFADIYEINNGVSTVMRVMAEIEKINRMNEEMVNDPSISLLSRLEFMIDNFIYVLQELLIIGEEQEDPFNKIREKLSVFEIKDLVQEVLNKATGMKEDDWDD